MKWSFKLRFRRNECKIDKVCYPTLLKLTMPRSIVAPKFLPSKPIFSGHFLILVLWPTYIDIMIFFFFGMRLYDCLWPINVHKILISDCSSYMSSYIIFSFTLNYYNILGPYTYILIYDEHIFIYFFSELCFCHRSFRIF